MNQTRYVKPDGTMSPRYTANPYGGRNWDDMNTLVRSRPAGELHPVLGGVLLVGLFAIATLIVVAIGGK